MIKYVIFDMFETLVTLFNKNHIHYFGSEVAKDMGVDSAKFYVPWNECEEDRTLGKIKFEDVVKNIMTEFNCFSKEKYDLIVQKRYKSYERCFNSVRTDILSMLCELKNLGCKIGLLSNCFYEEAKYIRQSKILSFLDCAILSCEVGMGKPNEEIFKLCMKSLCQSDALLNPSDFLYIGDGGSNELEVATKLGMNVFQATWFLGANKKQPVQRKPEFASFAKPENVVKYIKSLQCK